MRDEINKILLSIDNGKINKIVIVRNNSLRKYDLNSIDLLKIYSDNVKELQEQYKTETNGLSLQGKVDKLYSLGKIVYLKKELITKIDIQSEGTDLEKLVVYYENKKEEYDNSFSNYSEIKNSLLNELQEQYGFSYDKLISLGLLTVDNKIKNVLEENKVGNLKIRNKKLISSILISAIAVTGIGIGSYKVLKNNNRDELLPKATVESNELVITPTDHQEITTNEMLQVLPTPPNLIPKEIGFISDINIEIDGPLSSKVLAKKTSDNKLYLRQEDNTDIIRMLNEIREKNIESIFKNEDESLLIIYYENFLDNNNIIDKAFIKYFSDIANKIIMYKYSNPNERDKISEYINFYNNEYKRLIIDNEVLVVYIKGERKEIYYKDLSKDAKDIITNIGFNNTQIIENKEESEEIFNELEKARFFGMDFYIFKEDKNYKSVGKKGVQPDNACLTYSRAWVADYMSGTTNFKDSGLTFYGVGTEDKQAALEVIRSEIMKGRPVVIRVNGEQDFYTGKKKKSRRHFVVACGIKVNIDPNNLKESDFLIYDPTYSSRFKLLGSHAGGGTNDRKLLKTEQNPGWNGSSYSKGYYLEVFSDSSEYIEREDIYEGNIKY